MIEFRILKKSKKSRARLGILKTPHGEVETPAFVPVATQAAVKALSTEEALRTGSQILIANTFHLHLKPGEAIVKKGGGVHGFMKWPRPLMTDSGGFQVFSLGFGSDLGMGKMLKEKSDAEIAPGQQPRKIQITEDGVWFRSPIDGKKLFIGPKESMRIQEALGADIIFAFDECTSPVANHAYTKLSLEKSHRWAERCLREKRSKQALYGIVQGGKFRDLREESARFIGALPFDGFGIGGEFGDDKAIMMRMIRWVVDNLPEGKPRHMLGIGHLKDIPKIIASGIDTFDCIIPTHYARRGIAFTSHGTLNMRQVKYYRQHAPLDRNCPCAVCATYTRAYITHLFRAGELEAYSLLTFHNLSYFNAFVASIRTKIRKGLA